MLVPLLVLVPRAAAQKETALSSRALVVRSDAVVQAEPTDPGSLRRFRVTEVLRGSGLGPGDILTPEGMQDYSLQILEPRSLTPRPCHPLAALLFLVREGPKWKTVWLGLRLLDRDGTVLEPQGGLCAANIRLTPRRDLPWDDLLRQIRMDCAAVQRLMNARALPRTAERNRALRQWVSTHGRDFGTASGWGWLEEDTFGKMLAGSSVEEAWAVVQLYARLHEGELPHTGTAVFATPAGRKFLLRQAQTESLEGDRVRALMLLGLPPTLRPSRRSPGCATLDDKECADLVAGLALLLKAQDAGMRAAAARALQMSVLPPGEKPGPAVLGALSALEEAYRAEVPGSTRDSLARAIHALCSAQRWQQLTGNPHALLACLQDFEREPGKLTFWIDLQSDGIRIQEAPTLRLERLQGERVVDRQELRLEFANAPAPWQAGWMGPALLSAQCAVRDLKPGTWRATVRGTAGKGKDKVSWLSEPRTFTVAAPRNGGSDSTMPGLWETRLGR